MLRIGTAALLLLVLGTPPSAADESRVLALAQSYADAAVRETYWPGFAPIEIPLAIHDGTHTYLFRHPSPPEEFAPLPDSDPPAHRMTGRHPTVIANSTATIGDVTCATLNYDAAMQARPLDAVTSTAIHEAFHVYQRREHPDWMGNDGDLFIYPVEDPRLLTLRRLETEYLRRACAATDEEEAAANTRLALDARTQRFAAMDDAFPAYEHGTELNEGLATYVQARVMGQTHPDLPPDGYAAEDVRLRCYQTGLSIALLLDRFQPGWREELEKKDDTHLEDILAQSLGAVEAEAPRITAQELVELKQAATNETSNLQELWKQRRIDYLNRPGWQLIIETPPDAPLWPAGFDPWNIQRTDAGILHTRFLRLSNEHGQLELMNGTALTESAGGHPLFNGVIRIVLTGLDTEPELSTDGSRIIVTTPIFTAEFNVREVESHKKCVIIHVPGSTGG